MQIRSSHLVLMFSVVFVKAVGQSTDTSSITKQIWLDFNPQFTINSKFIAYGRVDVRTIFPQTWYQLVTGGGMAYKRTPSWSKKAEEQFHGGVGLFYTFNKSSPNRFELRVFQGYRLRWPNFVNLAIQNYVRLEERFEFTGSGDDFGLRLRYQIEATFRCMNCNNSLIKPLYLLISNEFFINLNGSQQFNDVIRVGPGVGYTLPSGWRPEFDFIFNRSRQTAEAKFVTSSLIFRLRLFYRIPERKG